jgi:predicted alpha/beta superfamily hydrolase
MKSLFFTDGNEDFQVVKAVTNGQIPPMVLVGIGYPDEDYMVRAGRRSVDLTPTLDEGVAARTLETYGVNVAYGGGPEFLEFNRSDVIPFMEEHYCASRIRALGGYSYGGLFAAFVLLSDPGLFDRFVIGSPSFWWDDRVVFKMEDTHARTHSDIQAQIFMSIGGEEDGEYIGDLFSFSQALRNRRHPGLTVTTRLWENEDHITAKVPTYHQGIRVIFADMVGTGG